MDINNPAIVAVGFNRLECTRRLCYALENAYYENEVTLILSFDYCENNDKILRFAENFNWSHGEKIVRVFETHQGLKQHVIQCADYSMKYGAVIIFEDDILPSPYFYAYIKKAIGFYRDDPRVFAM